MPRAGNLAEDPLHSRRPTSHERRSGRPFASRRLSVLGVDVAETALAIARKKAASRGIEVEFTAADVFELERWGRVFQTVLDCGLFHTLEGDESEEYAASLASVTRRDGTLYLLCFSDGEYDTGPHPVSQAERGVQGRHRMDCRSY